MQPKWLICADATAIWEGNHWLEAEDALENLFMCRFPDSEWERFARENIDGLSIMTEEEFNTL